ncbi:MAG: PA14 domain-containing protein [Bacillota bacterium]
MTEALELRQLLTAIPPAGFDLFTDAAVTTPGLVGTYINRSLRSYSAQNDWRATQSVAGTRTDPILNFTSDGWGSRAEVGLTHGTDDSWDDFSVQWDGYIRIYQDGTPLATRSDDGSRMWIDINGDGKFGTSGSEFVNNHWGSMQGATTGPNSVPLKAGVYKIRIQYEDEVGGNSMQLLPAVAMVRVAYIVPSNRTPQAHAVDSLQNTIQLYQNWYRDQMQRNGFGDKTFRLETCEDGVTPKIHVVNVEETDDYIRQDMWGKVSEVASKAGVPIWAEGQVWLLVPETHIMKPDGSIDGGVCLGAGWGSCIDGGVGMVGSNGLAVFQPQSLTDNRSYDGLTIADIGPYSLKQSVSYAWFEGDTISSLASTYLGAALHEMSHGFGMPHDFRNDDNFHGNLMGNGLRGMRGAAYPDLYPSDDLRLSYGQAMALSTLPYFTGQSFPIDRTQPGLSVQTTGSVTPVNGLLQIRFSASDTSGLACAMLDRNGEQIDEMSLSGSSATKVFATPYYTPDQADNYAIRVYDKYGNRRTVEVSITPASGGNRAPQPFVYIASSTVNVGKPITFDASRTSDPDHSASSLKVEWDLDGDGVFDTAPSTSKTITKTFTQAGTRVIRARITDPAGAVSLSAPIGIRIVPTMTGGNENNNYYLRVDPADADLLQVFKSNSPTGTPAMTLFRNDARPLVINSGGGNDELLIDFSNGNPIPDAGLQFDGEAGNNRLRITGTTNADTLIIDEAQILAGALPIDYINASLYLGRSDAGLPITLAGLELQPFAKASLASGGGLRVNSLTISPDATLDLSDGHLIVSATVETRQAVYAQLSQWILAARNEGAWTGKGLTSSLAKANQQTGLSFMINEKDGSAILSTFAGQSVGANDILVKYTWNGDVDMNGQVDGDDYFLVDSGFITRQSGYRNGDLNLDGKVDGDDYFLIDSAFIAQSGMLAAQAAPVVQQLFSAAPVLATETQDLLS